jgi:hypothetical protein
VAIISINTPLPFSGALSEGAMALISARHKDHHAYKAQWD